MARKLEAAGFSGAQAEGAAEAMAGAELATKTDLLAVKADLKADLLAVKTEPETKIEREIGLVRTDMTAMETRLAASIAAVQNGPEPLRRDIMIRLGTMLAAGVGIILTAMRLIALHP